MDNNSQSQFADTKQLESNGSVNFTTTDNGASATTTTSSGPTFHFLLFLCLLMNFINAYNKLERANLEAKLNFFNLLIVLLFEMVELKKFANCVALLGILYK